MPRECRDGDAEGTGVGTMEYSEHSLPSGRVRAGFALWRTPPLRVGGQLLLCLLLWAPCEAPAQTSATQPAVLDDVEGRFEVSLGAFLKDFRSTIQVGLNGLELGTEIDLENDLGFDADDANFRLDGHYKFTSRSRLEYGYYFWRRSTSKVLEDQIEWADTVFDVGLEVWSRFDADVFKAAYGYSILQRSRSDLALTVGISAFDFDIGIGAVGSISGGPGDATGELEEKETLLAPAPVLGVTFTQLVGDTVLLRLSGEYFALGVNDWDASLVDLGIYLDWFPWPNVGLGLAYNYVDLSYDKSGRKVIAVEYEYRGPVFSVLVRF